MQLYAGKVLDFIFLKAHCGTCTIIIEQFILLKKICLNNIFNIIIFLTYQKSPTSERLRLRTLLHATLRYATQRYATQRYATLRYATLLYATQRYATLRSSTLVYAPLR
jgi:hypothetical protein